VVSRTGNAAGASREVTIPAGWRPPFALRFFCADDYFADPEKHKPGQLGTESFFEHRFKQVLIDDTVIWDRDVIDENVHGSQTIFELDITPYVTAGKPFKLTFRAFDKVSTLERNDRDVWFIGGTWYASGDGKTEQPPRFHTAVWFADPIVGEQAAVRAAPLGRRPHEEIVARRHRQRWPMPPRAVQMPSPARLELVTPASIPPPGFPLTCGIPMPPGALRDVTQVQLHDRRGHDLPVQAEVTGWWPDGSIRWLLLNTIAPAGSKPQARFRLHFNEGHSPRPPATVKIERRTGGLVIDTGAVRLELGGDEHALLDAVYLHGAKQPLMTNLAPQMSILEDDQPVPVLATCRQVEVVQPGPIAARIEVHGSLDTATRHIGRFTFRLYAYAGLPTIQTHFRIYDDLKPQPYTGTLNDPPLDVADLALVATVPGASAGRKTVGIVDGEPFSTDGTRLRLLQDTHEHFTGSSIPSR